MRKYRAFISYNHGDERIARKLHRRMEGYRLPKRLEPRPRRLDPVFRDRDELAAATNLPNRVTEALENSENLVVLCSPRAAQSEWVNKEVAAFAGMHGADRIFPVIVEGEAPTCFPPALIDATPNPLAADLQEGKDGFDDGALKLIAALLPAPYAQVKDREIARARRRTRITGGLAGVFGLLLIAAVALGFRAVEETRRANSELTRAEAAILTLVRGIEEIVDQVAVGAATGAIGTGAAAMLLATAEGMAERAIAQAPDNSQLNTRYGELLIELSLHFARVGDIEESQSTIARARAIFDSLAARGEKVLLPRTKAMLLQGDAAFSTGAVDAALGFYNEAIEMLDETLRRRPDNTFARTNRAVLLSRRGDIKAVQGDLDGALALFREAATINREVVARDPGNPGWKRDLSISLERIGDVLLTQGDLAGALTNYEASLAMTRDLAGGDGGNTELARDLAIALSRVGAMRATLGDLAGALADYEEGLAINRDLSERDPGNAEWARDLSVSFNAVGEILKDKRDFEGGLSAYEEALKIRRRLLRQDPSNASRSRDVAVSLDGVGDILLAQDDLAGALIHYEEALAIARNLVSREPANSEWARDLSVSLNGLGDVLFAKGDLKGASAVFEEAVEIRSALFDNNPGHTRRARDFSISLNKFGDVLFAGGDLSGAREVYLKGISIARDLARLAPDNVQWARDLCRGLDKVGDLMIAAGDPAGASGFYGAGLALRRDLFARLPEHSVLAREIVASHAKLAHAKPEEAFEHWAAALAMAEALDEKGALAPADYLVLDHIRAQLAAARAD